MNVRGKLGDQGFSLKVLNKDELNVFKAHGKQFSLHNFKFL